MSNTPSLRQLAKAMGSNLKNVNQQASAPTTPDDGEYLAAARPITVTTGKDNEAQIVIPFVLESQLDGSATRFRGMTKSIFIKPFQSFQPTNKETKEPVGEPVFQGAKNICRFFKSVQTHADEYLFFDPDAQPEDENGFDIENLQEYIDTYNDLVNSTSVVLPLVLSTRKGQTYQNAYVKFAEKKNNSYTFTVDETVLYEGQEVTVKEIKDDGNLVLEKENGEVFVVDSTNENITLP